MTAPPPAIIDEAAEWLVTQEDRALSEAEKSDFTLWRTQSPQHEQAWQAVLRFKEMMGNMPTGLGKQVWGRSRVDRRAMLKVLAGFAVLPFAGKLAWDQWPALTADYRTATGERRDVTLPDGSQLQLNTATRVNIAYSHSARLIQLVEGEILLTTAPDKIPQTRPFMVDTPAGRIRALGTRFSVRHTDNKITRVSVFEHAVAIRPSLLDTEIRLEAGQAIDFDRRQMFSTIPLDQPVPSWTRGQIISNNQRLGDFVAELARYRPGLLRCDPAVAELRISGVFQLDDTEQALLILANNLPVQINRTTDYWVTVSPQ